MRSNLRRIDSQVVVPLTYRGRQPISAFVALEHTAWRATSSTNDQFSVDDGWRHPKDLHVRLRFSSSCDVPRYDEIWETMPVSMWDRSTLEVTTTSKTTGSTSWLPSTCRTHRRTRSFPDSRLAISPRTALTTPSSDDDFSLFALPPSAILPSRSCSFFPGLLADVQLLCDNSNSPTLVRGRKVSSETGEEIGTDRDRQRAALRESNPSW